MRIAYVDAQSGASGDMLLGALAGAGCDLARLGADLERIPVGAFRLRTGETRRSASRCTKVDVEIDPSAPERKASEIASLLERAPLPEGPRERILTAYRRLWEAQAAAHGVGTAELRFPGPEAVDLVVDLAGGILGVEALGIETLYASPLRLGSPGSDPRPLPVPHPAVLTLVQGWPVLLGGPARELTTPTGAAILTTLAKPGASAPPLSIEAVGCGAGTWDGGEWPNYLRLLVGTATAWEQDVVWQIEANLDNYDPEGADHLFELLLEAGAIDAGMSPLQMKKGRPGVRLEAIVPIEALEKVERVLFRETPTLGVRRWPAQREKLPRRFETAATPWGPVRIKIAAIGPGEEKASPEYEDLRRIARERGLPLPAVREAAMRAWREGTGEPRA